MSLINSLGKHPASNTSCSDGKTATSPATPPQLPPCPDPQEPSQGMPGCGCAWPGQTEPGDCVPRGAALLQLAFGGMWSVCVMSRLLCRTVLCPDCISLWTAHATAVGIPTTGRPCSAGVLRSHGKVVSCVWEQLVVLSCRRSVLSLARDHWCKVRSWRDESQAQCHG